MRQIKLEFNDSLKRYTTADSKAVHLIKDINIYPTGHADYKKENKNQYITYDRLMELQEAAMKNGYLFTY